MKIHWRGQPRKDQGKALFCFYFMCVFIAPPKARKLKNRNYRWINREQRNSGGDNPQKGWKITFEEDGG